MNQRWWKWGFVQIVWTKTAFVTQSKTLWLISLQCILIEHHNLQSTSLQKKLHSFYFVNYYLWEHNQNTAGDDITRIQLRTLGACSWSYGCMLKTVGESIFLSTRLYFQWEMSWLMNWKHLWVKHLFNLAGCHFDKTFDLVYTLATKPGSCPSSEHKTPVAH